jgi:predicted dehydrogenase
MVAAEKLKFGLVGNGHIAQYHKKAIEHVGGTVESIYDDPTALSTSIPDSFFAGVDFVTICSPNYLHTTHIEQSLSKNCRVICEKPLCMPSEMLILDDRINAVLQLRYMDLPQKAELVYVKMVRNADYNNSWKGQNALTGGPIYHLFIHYIDLAMQLGARFVGEIAAEGEQIRAIDNLALSYDTQSLYDKMYLDIVNGRGIKPKDLVNLYDRMKNSVVSTPKGYYTI